MIGSPQKLEFLKNGMNAVDVLAIIPYYVELGMSEGDEEEEDSGFKGILQVFRVFKLARIFKLARYSYKQRLVARSQNLVFSLRDFKISRIVVNIIENGAP